MREFVQIIKDVADIYGHDVEVMAEALDLSESTMNEILTGMVVPGEDFVKHVVDIYHLEDKEARELRRAWGKARTELAEKVNRMKRQFNATVARKSLGVDMNHVNTRWMYVLAASQFLHNTYVDMEILPSPIQEIVKMRNELVYNFGSDEYMSYTARLQDDSFWEVIFKEMEKALNT